ncbi:MAG: ERAP1-like C-terminal domain-containing protein, partial [Acidobacteriota bacterium]|nr:ERAP1-like C-terminal domain-containing protein [Acidobacteriota bacterium]
LEQTNALNNDDLWKMRISVVFKFKGFTKKIRDYEFKDKNQIVLSGSPNTKYNNDNSADYSIFPNYQDYGYGIFLLDEKSRDYVIKNIQNEKDDFLRTMMWGSLWDSVREAESSPKDYVELVIKNINVEMDESTIQTLLNRVSTAMNYYLSDAQRTELAPKIETILTGKMQNAPTLGQRITFYRAFLNVASSENARTILKGILSGKFKIEGLNCRGDSCGRPMSEAKNVSASRLIGQAQDLPLQNSSTILKTKDKFDIVTKLLILGDKDTPSLLAELEKTETTDEAKRYAYAAKAGIAAAESKAKFWNNFVNNKDVSESWIESAFVPFNSVRHSELTLPYLERALAELPNLKRNRKIFFVNGWLAAFVGGQRSERALAVINKFLADNPNMDKDLRLKILETVDGLERAVKIRKKFVD